MQGAIASIFGMFKNLSKKITLKMFLTFFLSVIFFVLLFPFNDLGDLVTSKISDATSGNVYLVFDKMALSFLPLGIQVSQVTVETPTAPSLKMDSLAASPWIPGLLAFKLGADIHATGLFRSDVDIGFKQTGKTTDGVAQSIDLNVAGLSLPAVSEYLHNGNLLNLMLTGSLDLNTSLTVDSSYKTQPDGTITATGKNFGLPSQSFMTTIGPLQTPQLKLGTVSLRAKMGSSRLEIEDFAFGGAGQDITGKIKGELGIVVQSDGRGGAVPILKDYDLRVDMTASKSFMDPNTNPTSVVIGGFLGQYQNETPQGSHFAFRMKSPKIPGTPPELSALK